MKLQKTMLIVLFAFVLCVSAYAQEATVLFYYMPDEANTYPALGCPCTTHAPYPDGATSWCVYWDNNNNGPDAADVIVPLGSDYTEASYQCGVFNGMENAGQLGYFYPLAGLIFQSMPVAPDFPTYWIQVSTTGANSCCWRTRSYTLLEGYQEVGITWADWTCADQACGGGGERPHPVTNVSAGDEDSCMAVLVSWTHDHLLTNSYNVYMDGTFIKAENNPNATSTLVQVSDCMIHSFQVRASNSAGESDVSTSDTNTGSAYLIRFHPDSTNNNISGYELAGDSVCLAYQRPTEECFSHVTLYLVRNGVRMQTPLIGDSLTLRQCFRMPQGTTDSLRVLMVAYLMTDPSKVCYDTTDTFFSLGPNAVDPQHLLLPDRFTLAQNFPNPFNPSTTIEFSVPFTADVKIQVYNTAGQLVRTLANSNFSSGVYSMVWDSRSDAGTAVGAGLYFCRMSSGSFAQTTKMLLIK